MGLAHAFEMQHAEMHEEVMAMSSSIVCSELPDGSHPTKCTGDITGEKGLVSKSSEIRTSIQTGTLVFFHTYAKPFSAFDNWLDTPPDKALLPKTEYVNRIGKEIRKLD